MYNSQICAFVIVNSFLCDASLYTLTSEDGFLRFSKINKSFLKRFFKIERFIKIRKIFKNNFKNLFQHFSKMIVCFVYIKVRVLNSGLKL